MVCQVSKQQTHSYNATSNTGENILEKTHKEICQKNVIFPTC
jgi:hypothetical protein